MSKFPHWFKGLLSLLIVATLALALAWRFRAARQDPGTGQAVSPTSTPLPEEVVTSAAPLLTLEVMPTATLLPTEEANPTATPESQELVRILYAVQPPGEAVTLWTLDYDPATDEVTTHELTTSPYESAAYFRVYEVSVSPDGQYVALNLRGGAENLDYLIWMLQTDGAWLRQFTSLKTSPPMFWDWMPDSKTMLVGERDGEAVGTIDMETGDFYEIPLVPAEDYHHTVIDAAISPDGKDIAFSIGLDSAIWLVPLDGDTPDISQIKMLSPPRRRLSGVFSEHVVWSPAGDKIAYFELLMTEMSEIQVLDVAWGEVSFLSSDDAHNLYPVWSADGTALVYIQETTPGIIPWIGGYWTKWNSSVWVAEVETGRYNELVPSEGKACWSAIWLPGGSGVVFVSNRRGQSDVWVVNRDGTGLHPLTDQGDVVALDILP